MLDHKGVVSMNGIERQMIGALEVSGNMTAGNTAVINGEVFLHGHKIFWKDGDNCYFTLAGHPTKTTKSRLNALMQHHNLGRGFIGKYVYIHGWEPLILDSDLVYRVRVKYGLVELEAIETV